jgi:transcriptional regulator with GAF, ATPase, and Fis domain
MSIEQATSMATASISEPTANDAGDLPVVRAIPFDLPPDGIDLDALERHLVVQALARTGGNKTRAGTLLGLTRDQVRYRLQKYGLDRDD